MASSSRSLLIYGAGGHGLVIAEAARAAGMSVEGFIDDDPPDAARAGTTPVFKFGDVNPTQSAAIVGIGDNVARQRIQRQLIKGGWTLANVIHPRAWISPSAELGRGVFIAANAVVNADARLGDGVIVNTGAIVEHHCQIGDFCHVAPNATLCGSARVGDLALIGAGASVLPVIHVGNRGTVGAGAVVLRDVGEGVTVAGNPARPLHPPDEFSPI